MSYRPISEASYYVLLALHEPRNGAEIVKRVEELTEGRLIIPPGTLYPLLSRMEAAGQIELVADGYRKTYALTREGRQLLFYEYKHIADMAMQGAPVIFLMREREEDLL